MREREFNMLNWWDDCLNEGIKNKTGLAFSFKHVEVDDTHIYVFKLTNVSMCDNAM